MSFQVSALKFRPQRFDEVVGQEHVTETLRRGLQSERVAHALLFCGPRGVGKTTIARILAKALNCENPGTDREPCNQCLSCESFNSGASFNIIELDAASNNKVEDIRHLVEQVGYQPQRGRFKVFIIDEVHMLSSAAFNAFLKTLEEPPPYAIFILATTEKHKILPTILSRCQIYDFKRIPIPEMVRQMTFISEKEGLEFEEEGLNLIAQKADGALRDALSLFDKLNSVTNRSLTYQNIIKSLNLLDRGHFFDFTDWFLKGDTESILISFDQILNDGFEGDILLEGLLEHFRELFVSRDPKTQNLMQSGERFIARYKDQGGGCSRSFLLSGMNVISDALFKYKEANNKRMFTELTLCKLAVMNHFLNNAVSALPGDIPVKSTVQASPQKKTELESAANSRAENSDVDTNNSRGEVNQFQAESQTKDKKSSESHTLAEPEDPPIKKIEDKTNNSPSIPQLASLSSLKSRIKEKKESAAASTLDLSLENVERIWNNYSEKVESKSIAVSLKNAVLSVDGNSIKIAVPGEVAKQTIRSQKKLLEKLRRSFGSHVVETTIQVDESLRKEEDNNGPKLTSSREKYHYMAEKNPNLNKLMDALGLKVSD